MTPLFAAPARGRPSGTPLAMAGDMSTLPGSQTRALWMLALFAAIQVADGVLTAAGVERFGTHIEANPLIHLAVQGVGLGITLVTAKLLAMSCATVLHIHSRHLVLAVLTAVYVVGAIVPWTVLLYSSL
jgi:hypothetical protein